jgi:hypothetical protein
MPAPHKEQHIPYPAQTKSIGDSVTFDFPDGGGSVLQNFFWLRGNIGQNASQVTILENGVKYTGVNTRILTIHDLTTEDASQSDFDYYFCVGVEDSGMDSLVEFLNRQFKNGDQFNAANLIVEQTDSPPSIDVQPSTTIAKEGESASFSVIASGSTPLTYAWKQSGGSLPSESRFVGGDTSTLQISNLKVSDSDVDYTCVVSNAFGEVETEPATLIVERITECDLDLGRDLKDDEYLFSDIPTKIFNLGKSIFAVFAVKDENDNVSIKITKRERHSKCDK